MGALWVFYEGRWVYCGVLRGEVGVLWCIMRGGGCIVVYYEGRWVCCGCVMGGGGCIVGVL